MMRLSVTRRSIVPTSSRSAAPARRRVASPRPSDAQITRAPLSRAAAPTAAPISPGCSSPITVVIALLSARGLLARPLGHGESGALPLGEAAVHLDHARQAHLLGDVGRERRAPRAVAIEHELLARREDVLVIRTVGIDPELEHAARTVERAGNHALPLELADVAQVHEDRLALGMARARLLESDGGDARLRLVDQLAKAFLELHGHTPPRSVDRLRMVHRRRRGLRRGGSVARAWR